MSGSCLERERALNIFKLQNEVWKIAEEKGWHEGEVSFGDFISNSHAELSEAFEIYRVKGARSIPEIEMLREGKQGNWKPEGIPIELADVIMRVLDFCETSGIDIEEALTLKMEFNKTRKHRHGGKVT
jgi:NTP pyrophosphatase (non-canonical NTP hydrolase)